MKEWIFQVDSAELNIFGQRLETSPSLVPVANSVVLDNERKQDRLAIQLAGAEWRV